MFIWGRNLFCSHIQCCMFPSTLLPSNLFHSRFSTKTPQAHPIGNFNLWLIITCWIRIFENEDICILRWLGEDDWNFRLFLKFYIVEWKKKKKKSGYSDVNCNGCSRFVINWNLNASWERTMLFYDFDGLKLEGNAIFTFKIAETQGELLIFKNTFPLKTQFHYISV